jgi:hypothetical protein
MKLRRAEAALLALTEYMMFAHGAPEEKLCVITLKHDEAHDKENEKDPRAFCFVEKENPTVIHCSKAIEDLQIEARFGVIYHEIGHIVLNAFHGDESEVDVDEWCVNFLPEAEYTYKDTPYITPYRGGVKLVLAKSLQNVSLKFLRMLRVPRDA